ncbi:MAG: aldo/keto reductase [Phycisphaerae bacterium]
MNVDRSSRVVEPVALPPSAKTHNPLALGTWAFGGTQWGGQEDANSLAVMDAARKDGILHFDTATGYGNGRSETLVGQFIKDHGIREQVFLASKQGCRGEDGDVYYKAIEDSLSRLQTDYIDLYYIHWPKSDADMRPTMKALERARGEGKVKTIGVSNFSVDHMRQVGEAGKVDAHQIGYSLLWRWAEKDVIPYCQENGVAVVTYSSIAQGILTGKFKSRQKPTFPDGDQRNKMVLFDENVWPHVFDGVQKMQAVADRIGRSLTELSIRWAISRPFVTSVLVGARDAGQMHQNAQAVRGEIDPAVFDELTAISDETLAAVPDTGNLFRYYP